MFTTPHIVPCYRIFVHNEIVTRIERWTSWQKKPYCTITISREPDSLFKLIVNDPDFSARPRMITFDQVSTFIHADVIKHMTDLFALLQATDQAIAKIGIGTYELIKV